MAGSFRLPNQADYFNAPLGTYDITGTQNFDFSQPFQAGNISGFVPGGGITADYSGGAAANAFSGTSGLGSWGGMQAVGGIANTLFNQLGNAQGTTAGNQFFGFLGDKRDADFGSALIERNIDMSDQLRYPRIIAKMRANDPSIRQADRRADLANLAGKYGQLGGFLA
jgi:hypothetical protein